MERHRVFADLAAGLDERVVQLVELVHLLERILERRHASRPLSSADRAGRRLFRRFAAKGPEARPSSRPRSAFVPEIDEGLIARLQRVEAEAIAVVLDVGAIVAA